MLKKKKNMQEFHRGFILPQIKGVPKQQQPDVFKNTQQIKANLNDIINISLSF